MASITSLMFYHSCLENTQATLIEYDELLSQAEYLFSKRLQEPSGKKKAYEILNHLVRQDPTNIHATRMLAELLRTGGEGVNKDPAESEKLFRNILRIDPNNDYALSHLAELLIYGGNGVELNATLSLEYFLKALSINPNNAFALARLGDLFRVGADGVAKDQRQAYALLERALTLFPDDPFAKGSLGDLLHCGVKGVPRDRVRAKRLLEDAVAMIPNDVFTLTSLGILHAAPGDLFDPALAMRYFEKALLIAPNAIETLLAFSNFLLNGSNSNNTERALDCCERVLALDPENPLALSRAGVLLYALDRDLERALTLLERALAIRADDIPALCSLADFYGARADETKNDSLNARKFFEQVLKLEQDNFFALTRLAELLRVGQGAVQKDEAYAETLLDKALRVKPDHPFVLGSKAEIFRGRGDTKKAKAIFEKIIHHLDPNNDFALSRLAEILREGKGGVHQDVHQARVLYQRALAINPANILANIGLNSCQIRAESSGDTSPA